MMKNTPWDHRLRVFAEADGLVGHAGAVLLCPDVVTYAENTVVTQSSLPSAHADAAVTAHTPSPDVRSHAAASLFLELRGLAVRQPRRACEGNCPAGIIWSRMYQIGRWALRLTYDS